MNAKQQSEENEIVMAKLKSQLLDAKHEINRLNEKNNEMLELGLNQYQEIANLRNENRILREQLEGKPATDQEQRLLRIAKSIIQEYERELSLPIKPF